MPAGSILLVVAAAVLVGALLTVLIYNALKAGQFACDAAWSLIDVQLSRRAALVPNLVETVRGYAAHEQALQDALAAGRAEAVTRGGPSDAAVGAELQLDRTLGSMLGLAEQYPALLASEHFLKLQDQLVHLEDQIAASREIYNGNVERYRTRCQQPPSSWVARAFRFPERRFFTLADPQAAHAARLRLR